MDTIELCAAAVQLVDLHERFIPCFGRRQCRGHTFGSLRSLLLAKGRKSVEAMALLFGGLSDDKPNIDSSIALAWQRFLTVSPWRVGDVQQELQTVFNEEFVPTASWWSIGTVGVIDGSGFVKRGTESVGVQRQARAILWQHQGRVPSARHADLVGRHDSHRDSVRGTLQPDAIA